MENETLILILSFTLPCLMTTLGSLLIFFFSRQSKMISMLTIGLAAGIMLSASLWSLLVPALENAQQNFGNLAFLPVVFGILLGSAFMLFLDWLSNKFFSENGNKSMKKAFKLFTAITIHNIPEGLSVGFAVGTAVAIEQPMLIPFMFALGIALQNLPEGLATALPLHNCHFSKTKSFLLGTASGLVEPLFAIIGYFLASYITSLLPWLLSFSAGAMIYVIVEEMIPEIHTGDKLSFGTLSFIIGFVIMMILDICL